MILHENRLPADDSHAISCLICYLWKSGKICDLHLLQIIGGALRVKSSLIPQNTRRRLKSLTEMGAVLSRVRSCLSPWDPLDRILQRTNSNRWWEKSILMVRTFNPFMWERSGSVVECLTRDRRAAGSSLTGVTALWSLSKTHLS